MSARSASERPVFSAGGRAGGPGMTRANSETSLAADHVYVPCACILPCMPRFFLSLSFRVLMWELSGCL